MPTPIFIFSGVTSSGLTISSGEQLLILSGGVLQSSTVLSGGEVIAQPGAVADVTVSSGGEVISQSGVVADIVVSSGGAL